MWETSAVRGEWKVEQGTEEEESGQYRSLGAEGEWRLGGADETREFTMRDWGNQPPSLGEGGEWDLRSGRDWGEVKNEIRDDEDEREEEGGTFCCCSELFGVKVVLAVFAVFNLGIIATGGVGFTLGLVNYWEGADLFTFIMIGSSCLVCWGTLATTMDILALLGIQQGKRGLVMPWLLWYLLEVVTFVAVIVVSMVYTETYYLLPLLGKTFFTAFAWYKVRHVYRNSFGTFYTKEPVDVIY